MLLWEPQCCPQVIPVKLTPLDPLGKARNIQVCGFPGTRISAILSWVFYGHTSTQGWGLARACWAVEPRAEGQKHHPVSLRTCLEFRTAACWGLDPKALIIIA